MAFAELLVTAAAGYLLVGLAFGLAFVTAGVGCIDPAARGTSVVFRVVILPGSALLWPMLAAKWVARARSMT